MDMDDFQEFPDREAILGGLPAKRANTLIFLIESRTAHMMAQSRQAVERFLTEEVAQERELAFLEAFALGREPPLRTTIQDLERYAPQWARLIPENPRVQAAVAHRLIEKYRFMYGTVPGIRAALGLDDAAVQEAYQELYHTPLEAIYAPRTTVGDRLRFTWAVLAKWLENLPPFWIAYALTLTETVGATILALPIAVAGIGPLAGVVVLIVLGMVNMLTIAYMAEAVSRSGTIRYGSAFVGRMVTDYLGGLGATILSLSIFALCFLVLQAFYLGFATSLQDATQVPSLVWVVVLFLVGIFFLRRESLNATIASALVVGVVNIGLVVILSLLALAHMQPGNLSYINVPFLGGQPFDRGILELIFGVILAAYFGHLSVSNCGRVVLQRDGSGRSLIRGTVAAQATAMVLYCLFVVAVNGAIAPQILVRQSGTVLGPLAAELGPSVHVLGSVFVILGMGMASIHISLALFNLTREWLPARSEPIIMLPRRRGRLLFHEKGRRGARHGAHIELSYFGLKHEKPHFRLQIQVDGQTYYVETTATGEWDIIGRNGESPLLDRVPALRERGVDLRLEIMDSSHASVRMRVTSSLRISYEGEWDAMGVGLADVLTLPDAQAELVGWMTRQGEVSLADVAVYMGQAEPDARTMLNGLVERGVVGAIQRADETQYETRIATRRGRQLPQEIWQALAEDGNASPPADELPPPSSFGQRLHRMTRSEHSRFLLGISPIIAAFLSAEWLLLTGAGSFAGLLSFLGVIVVSLLAGIFPVLLLLSSRRKGEYVPAVVYRFIGHPVLLIGTYLLSLASVFLHGLVIWEHPIVRTGAIGVGIVIIMMTIIVARRGAFNQRVTIELRRDQREADQARFTITANGQAAVMSVQLRYPEGEQRKQLATDHLPAFGSLCQATFGPCLIGQAGARFTELKVWGHTITPMGASEGLPALVEVHHGAKTEQFDLQVSGGHVVLPLSDSAWRVDIRPKEWSEGGATPSW